MAIQYPKLEHVTLPSVDGFNGSFNILRDPPKSIFTKRIDKVGQNNDIIDDIDMSGDRMSEGIKVYARGVNPMVSVSYDNNSNNAGSFTSGAFGQGNYSNQGHHTGNRQAFLPYRIGDKGAFRPPIRSQRDLMPLSRQPRAWFQALTNPGFADFTKKKFLPTQFRMIRDIVLKTDQVVKPNHSVKIEKPILENMKDDNYNYFQEFLYKIIFFDKFQEQIGVSEKVKLFEFMPVESVKFIVRNFYDLKKILEHLISL